MFMDRDEVEAHKLEKKEQGQYPAILSKQAWSIKDLLYCFWGNISYGMQQVNFQAGKIAGKIAPSCPLG